VFGGKQFFRSFWSSRRNSVGDQASPQRSVFSTLADERLSLLRALTASVSVIVTALDRSEAQTERSTSTATRRSPLPFTLRDLYVCRFVTWFAPRETREPDLVLE
jgi:hypothetical protein